MDAWQHADPELHREYRAAIEGEPLRRALRRAVFVLFAINTVFVLVDHIVYPESFLRFLPVRIVLDVALVAIFFGTSRTHPVASSFATVYAGAAMLFAVVLGTGGPHSDYYVGIVLLLIGTGVLAPLSIRQGTIAIGSVFLAYAVLPALDPAPVEWTSFALHLFFLGAAAFVGVMSCAFFERMRFADFRQRREIERARDELAVLDEEKSRFTANVHHELRTPLTLMLAPLEAMLSGEFGDVPPQQRGYLETMHTNGLRLLKLISNLLDLAKIESGRLEIRRRPVRLGELALSLVAGARPLAERKGIALTPRGLEALPEVNADAEAIEKVVVNLLGNALKFTERGGRIELTGEVAEGGGAHLVVSDSGVGLARDQLERIFDRFAQADSSSTRRFEGTGIGLSLARELVKLHAGRIWAESDGPGRGTRMHVLLPVGEPDAAEAEPVLVDAGEAAATGAAMDAMKAELEIEERNREALRLADVSRHVERQEAEAPGSDPAGPMPGVAAPCDAPELLVCEDNPDMRRLLSDLLSREFRVRCAANGRDGLERIREAPPDLVLTDVMMPEMSGTELCRAIKEDPETRDIPVVLVTSKAEREMKIQGLELGADDYVTKPFHPRELLARVRSLVRVRRLQAQLTQRNRQLESANSELEVTLRELREAGVRLVQAERLAAVGELAAGIAHEVNNPVNFASNALHELRRQVEEVRRTVSALAAIDWHGPQASAQRAAELAKSGAASGFDEVADELAELVGIVGEGLERTRRLVGDLRDFAAPGDGRRASLDLRRGLESTVRLVGHALRTAGVELSLDLAEELPRVEGDARALNQVFLNLLKNAAEALEGRGGSVRIRARSEGRSVVVDVQDDGPGIGNAEIARVFEPFHTTKPAGRGTGLGLSISRRIVGEHGGTLEVGSEPGRGATFTVTLPAQEA
jgi:signal transduction histidine kinase